MIRAAVIWLLLALPATAFPIQRCVNLSNALEAPNEGDWGYRISNEDIAAIAKDGFDTIRLPVRVSNWISDGQIAPELLARVDQVIREALKHDLKVILDLHHFEELMKDPRAQADTFVTIWSVLSKHYADWPQELIFELLNEPYGPLDTAGADALYDRAIPIIRKTNPDRWIIVGGGHWNRMSEVKKLKPRDDRVAYTFHFYFPFLFTHQGAEWVDPPPLVREPLTQEEMRKITDVFAGFPSFGRPVLLGEFGAYQKVIPTKQRAVWTRAVREAAETAGLGWCHWGYASGFRLVSDDRTWLPHMREALFDKN